MNKYDLLVSPAFYPAMYPLFKNTIFLVSVMILVLIGLLYWFFGTGLAGSIRATGGKTAWQEEGINTDFNRVLGLMVSNGLVALSGALFLSQYQGFADINMGRGAIVIGLARDYRRSDFWKSFPQLWLPPSWVWLWAPIVYYLCSRL